MLATCPAAAAALMSIALCVSSVAQATVRAKVPADPYTQGDDAALKKAGYVSLGPFPFGTGHTSTQVSDLLGTEPLIWIETAHFRIGCALSPLPLKNDEPWRDEWVAKLKQELKRLAVRLPRVKTDVKDLDPWLRAHLIAQRVEELYAEVQGCFPAPEVPAGAAAGDAMQFRGVGPHLGMNEKFTVLLVRKSASHARYTRAYQGREIGDPIRHHDSAMGCMYWGASEETAESLFRHDYALQSHVIFNVAHNLFTGYRGYSHDLPAWLVTGLSHWHARRVSPRFPTYDRKHDEDKEQRSAFWEWDKRAPGLLRNGAFEPVTALMERTKAGSFGGEQHIQSWALVDFMMTQDKAKAMQFVHAMKEPFHGRSRAPTETELALRQLDAMKECLGWTPEQFEQEWRNKVLGGKGRR